MASRKQLMADIRKAISEIQQINQVELFMGTLPDNLFLDRLLKEAFIANTRLILFSSRNIEGDEI